MIHNGGKETTSPNNPLEGFLIKEIYMGEANGRKDYVDGKNFYSYKTIDDSQTITNFYAAGLPDGCEFEQFVEGVDDKIPATKIDDKGTTCVQKKLFVKATNKAELKEYTFQVTSVDPSDNKTTVNNKIRVKNYIPAALDTPIVVEVFTKDLSPEKAIGIYHEMYDNAQKEEEIRNDIKKGPTAGKVIAKDGYLPEATTYDWDVYPNLDTVTVGDNYVKATAIVKFQRDGAEVQEKVENIKIKVVDTKNPDIRRATLNTLVDKNNENQLDGKDFDGHAAFIGDKVANNGVSQTGLKFGYRTFDNSGRIKNFSFTGQPIGSTVKYAQVKDGTLDDNNSKGMDYTSGGNQKLLAFDDPQEDKYDTEPSPLFAYLFVEANNTNKIGRYDVTITSTDGADNVRTITNYINVKTFLPVALDKKKIEITKGEDASKLKPEDYIGVYLKKYDTKNALKKQSVLDEIKGENGKTKDESLVSDDKARYFPTEGTSYEWVTAPNTNQEPGEYKAKAKVKFTGKDGIESSEEVEIPYTIKAKISDTITPAYTEGDGIIGTQSTVSAPNFTDKNQSPVSKPQGTTFELGQNSPKGATIDANGEVKYTPTDADNGKNIEIPVIVKYSDGSQTEVRATISVPLTVNDPVKPAEVSTDDPAQLTEEDKAAIKKAIKDTNPTLNLEDGDITINADGSVKVTKNGKEATIAKDKAMKKADQGTNLTVNDPAKPAEVSTDDPAQLTEEDKAAIKKAIKDANPTLNLEDGDITINADGSVKVTKNGKEATIAKDKAMKKADQGTNLTVNDPVKPAEVSTDDPAQLTEEDKAAIKKAIKDANPTLNLEDGDITINADGSVKVTKNGKEATIAKDKAMKKADQGTNLTVNDPAKPAEVSTDDPAQLTEEDKAAIKKAIKDANPTLNLEDGDITINADGSVKVTKNGKEATIAKDKAMKKADQGTNLTVNDPVKPAEVSTDDPAQLTEEDKAAIKKAIKDANPTLNLEDGDITINADGSVKVTKNGKEATIAKDKAMKKADQGTNLTVNDPAKPAEVSTDDPAQLTEADKTAIKKAIKDANPTLNLEDGDITINADGSVKVTKNGKEATIAKDKAMKKADQGTNLTVNDPAKPAEVSTDDPAQLTEADKTAIKKAIKDANPTLNLEDGDITINADGSVKVTKNGKEATIAKDKAMKKADQGTNLTVNDPAKPAEVSTDDPAQLTEADKTAIKKAIKDANPTLNLEDGDITINADGSVKVTKNGKEATIAKDKAMKKADQGTNLTVNDPAKPAEVSTDDPAQLTEADKTAIKKAIKDANPTLNLEDGDITINADGSVKVTKNGKEATIAKDKAMKKADQGTNLTVNDPVKPAEVSTDDPAQLTEEDKAAIKKAIKDANPTLNLEDGDITINADGSVKVTKNGKEATIAKDKAMKKADQGTNLTVNDPVKPAEVSTDDPAQLTEADKAAIKKAIKDANTNLNLEDNDITINGDGSVTVKKGDKEAKLAKAKVMSKKADSNIDTGKKIEDFNYGHLAGLKYRDHYTKTHPVYVRVPEKTAVKEDTLWYVFHIDLTRYEVVKNGVSTEVMMDVSPVIKNNRTMLPLRYVAEALQAEVKWDNKTRTATFTKDGLTASIQIDSDEIVLSNGKTVKMDSKPLNINDRILVSVTNVANVFGLSNGNQNDGKDHDIEWNNDVRTATIYVKR